MLRSKPSAGEPVQDTLKARLKPLAAGLTPREVIAKFRTMQMVDVHIPTTEDHGGKCATTSEGLGSAVVKTFGLAASHINALAVARAFR